MFSRKMRDVIDEVGKAIVGEQDSPDAKLEIFPANIVEPLRFDEIFGNSSPVEIDLGSGPGKFLIETAKAFPERNFVGVERLLGRVRKTRRKALHAELWNLRVLRIEIDHAVRFLLTKNSVTRFHLYFPDPWPKRRHHSRRVVDAEFLEAISSKLVDGGEFWIKTDHREYFERIVKVSTESGAWFEPLEWSDEGYGTTDFEDLFISKEQPIYRLRLRKRI
jgi:tRNA (guanine-N7-)-methyltransferase